MEGKVMEKENCIKVKHVNGTEVEIPGLKVNESDSPTSECALKRSCSEKRDCLCSPTTHAGSFRCRHHRAAMRHTNSALSARDFKPSLQPQ
ncbi:hypothetical protein LR48_Vigan07g009800 [Vigna angularis]|uniref:Uncharacterized protein n=2 Tax=Phaseolus angularis TaxID=3914 RepID=A0A0L9UV27_PHAAN|nr:hypothetical protein LR48_Vigan07g009800 [Vigna angularis]BAT80571.1 hypothetical protein VIGAN_03016200 [Vigna angularis var. angularis]